jgi:hypothetical protein
MFGRVENKKKRKKMRENWMFSIVWLRGKNGGEGK